MWKTAFLFRVNGGKFPFVGSLPFFLPGILCHAACLIVLAVLLSSCSAKTHLSERDYRTLARAGITLGVDIDYADNHKLFVEASKWMGTPYRYGGNSKRGVDCSGLTRQIYKKVYRKRLSRSSRDQYENDCRHIRRKSQLQQGDLVFFRTPGSGRKCGHVGIFLKDGKFIHASSSRGVVVDRLGSSYWKKYWMAGGRVR